MSDEHDPRYASKQLPDTPQSEANVGEREFVRLQAKVEYLSKKIRELEAEEEDRLSTVEANLVEWERRYSYGKGVIGGIIIVCGVFGIFVVDTVKEVVDHVFNINTHNGGPK